MQIYFHSRISNLPFSDVQLDSRENDPPRSVYIRTSHRRWGVCSLYRSWWRSLAAAPKPGHTFGKKVAMNFMQGTAIPLDQRSLDAFEIGSHHDPPLLLLHAPANGFYSYRVMLFYHCVCVCVRARLVFLRPAAIYRFFLFPLSPSSLRFHRTTVVKIYAKSSSLPYIRR